MRTILGGLVIVAVAATVATYFRYHSFDPCNWMAQDMARHTGLPTVVTSGKIKADFLVRGITQPEMAECVLAWWRERADEAMEVVRKEEAMRQ
jgi:hypothetical protein